MYGRVEQKQGNAEPRLTDRHLLEPLRLGRSGHAADQPLRYRGFDPGRGGIVEKVELADLLAERHVPKEVVDEAIAFGGGRQPAHASGPFARPHTQARAARWRSDRGWQQAGMKAGPGRSGGRSGGSAGA